MTRVGDTLTGGRRVRRTPVQERSAVRVQRMLDAAAALLDEVGYDGTTTSAIAARADVSVGSLYQFFPDRAAVLDALAQRSFARFSALVEEQLGGGLGSWRDAVPLVVDLYAAFTRSEPAFRKLSFGGPVGARPLDPQQANNTVVAALLGRALAGAVPGLDETPDLELALRVAVEAGDAVLGLAFQHDPAGDPVLVEEAKAVVLAYLGTRLP